MLKKIILMLLIFIGGCKPVYADKVTAVNRIMQFLSYHDLANQADNIARIAAKKNAVNAIAVKDIYAGSSASNFYMQQFHEALMNLSEEQLEQSVRQLQSPLAVTFRRYEFSLRLNDVNKKIQQYQLQLSPDRLALIAEIDKLLKVNALMALLQSDIDLQYKLLNKSFQNKANSYHELLIAYQYIREESLQQDTLMALAYAYRYAKNEDLINYIALLKSESIQACQNAIVKSFYNNNDYKLF